MYAYAQRCYALLPTSLDIYNGDGPIFIRTLIFIRMHIYAERKVKNLYIIFLQNRNGIWQHLLSYKCFIIIAFHHNSYFSPLDTSLHRIISPSDASFPDYYPLTAVIPYSQMACSILSESLFRLVKRTVPHHETTCSMHRKRHLLQPIMQKR